MKKNRLKLNIAAFLALLLFVASLLTVSSFADPDPQTSSETASSVDLEAIKAQIRSEVESSAQKALESAKESLSKEYSAQYKSDLSDAISEYESSFEESYESEMEESLAEEASRRQVSEEASIAQSVAESKAEAMHYYFGPYDILTDLTGVTPPDEFEVTIDGDTFDEIVECFYSKNYKIKVFYASLDRQPGYYVYDQRNEMLMPFVLLSGRGDEKYVVTAPESDNDLPEGFVGETDVDLSEIFSRDITVPGYVVLDAANEKAVLLCLAAHSTGIHSYFVYDNSTGTIKLTPWEEYDEEHTTEESTTEETTEETTTETTAVTTEAPTTTQASTPAQGMLSNSLIWVIIIGGIILLLVVAVVIVVVIGRHQDARESASEIDDESEIDTFDGFNTYTSSYQQSEQEDEAFDVNFEDAFPDEMKPYDPSKFKKEDKPKTDLSENFDEVTEFGTFSDKDRMAGTNEPEEDVIADIDFEKLD